jgi:hypothetical protein
VSQTFKSSTLPAAGYLYQNLVGLEILLNWLDEPTRFSWVVLECEELAPKALDDIVAEYGDGTRLYRQVKCANDPDDPDSALSWSWLLEKSSNRRSLLRKLFDAWRELPESVPADISLVTNRRADRQFAETLVGSFIDWSRVPPGIKTRVTEELGPESEVTSFISRLKFQHSKNDFPLLQERLRSRFVSRYGDDLAWGSFKSEALEWLVLKGRNRISLEDVRKIAAKTRPRPLREDFEVPPGYSVPNESFHEEFLERVSSSNGGGFVLEGSPGQGKSTYLSHLCSELSSRGIPFVRHHYFLRIEPSNPRRFFMDDVANTFIHRIAVEYPEYRPDAQPKAEYLKKWVESCATGSLKEGKPFVVVIDGLDHLWREMDHDVAPLEALLSNLIPLPPNVVLVLGTQPLSDEDIPATLRQARSSFSWLQMPAMSPRAIARWVSKQIEEERFSPPEPHERRQEYIGEVANALYQISSGHPLHVIYSVEMLLNSKQPITSYWIEKLPPCPDGNIRSYYNELWVRLNYVAKDVLHLISAFEFLWSRDALLAVFGDSSETASALSSVRHLTHATSLGLKPFHSSLGAHVREYSEHNPQVRRLLPRVTEWLKDLSPDYLRWGWLWLTQARAGDSQPLVDGPSWSWALESLTRGYPPSQMVRIAEDAEELAFRNENYARAVELRWLKTRLLNGPDFQTNDFSRLTALTFELSGSTVTVEETLQDLGGGSTKNLNVLGEYLARHGRLRDAERCLEEVKVRFNRKVDLQLRSIGRSEQEAEHHSLVNLFGTTGKYDPQRLMHWINRGKSDREKMLLLLLLAISKQGDVARMLALTGWPKTKGMQQALELEAVRLACRLSVDLSGWPEFQRFTFHPLSACWALIHGKKSFSLPDHEIPEELLADRYFSMESEQILEDWLHWHFFWCLAKSFIDVAPVLPTIELPKVPWVTTAFPILEEAARFAGQRLRRGDAVGFSHVWRFLHRLVRGKGHEDRSAEFCLRRAMVHVATDLGLLNSSRHGSVPVSASDIGVAMDSGYFYIGHLRTRCLKRGERLLTTEDAADQVSGELDSLAKSVTPFNERVEQYFDLADFAWLYGLRQLTERSVMHAAQCILGYGAHKDYWVFRVLEAIATCGKSKLRQCDSWVQRIAPAVEQISEFTDGDDVHYAREQFAALLLDINPTLYVAYHQSLLRRAEWQLSEEVLNIYLKEASLSNPLQALIGTVFEGTILNTLITQKDSPVEKTARAQLANLGQETPHLSKHHSSPVKTSESDFDVVAYPPAKFDEFLEVLTKENRLSYDSKTVSLWFDYWAVREPAEVLRHMEQVFAKDDVQHVFRDIPDRLFETAMRLKGKEKAYSWLVLGHIHNDGWSSEYSRDTAYRRRFELLAKHYPEKWTDFIKKTSEPLKIRKRWSDTLIIGNSRLVEFLLLVGQSGPAAAVTEALVSCFEREVVEQPLPCPDWL